ncbi:tetratricopeptide repeat protein [Geomobilimonas luticola]|uniref:Tetratricopeptide repeat protein n=1 Tax=Geomobilimonas luticola TaxID=1114878 RepID=A0ABS5SCS1_9BACT|nr:tetratricopeptide repeat protein [Geomobilimonas luticola]MBT0652304.1 tetratricopeptide repeat protein [Geomobilimonas luticola]
MNTPQNNGIRFHGGVLLALLVVTACVYGRILGHEFLHNWDDNIYITANPAIQGFSWDHVRTVFSTYYAGNYAPVQMLSYMVDYQLWGLWPGGFLLSNLLIHGVNGMLVYGLLLRWHNDRLLAIVGASVFLLHPVQVESVAWISQRKNLLAMLFFLMAWERYCSYRDGETERRGWAYAASVVAFVLALLAKSAAVILPVVLVVHDRCFGMGVRRARWLDKVPYLAFAGIVAAVALHSQLPNDQVMGEGGGRATGYHGGSPLATFFTMLPIFCRYLGQLVWPFGLSAEYDPAIHRTPDLTVIGAGLVFAGMVWLAVRLYRNNRQYGFWPIYILIAFLPVSQVVPLVTLMNDRYFYFPLVGAAALAGIGAVQLRQWLGERRKGWLYPVLLVPLVFLSYCSFQRAAVWRNAVTLWRDAVTKTTHKASTWERLGEACHYANQPLREEAERAYRRALELDPKFDLSWYNLGVLHTEMGEYDKAFASLGSLLKNNPTHVMGLAALGDVHFARKEYLAAERAYKRANSLQPEAMQVVMLLGGVAFAQGKLDEARDYFRRVEAQWHDPESAFRLATVEARTLRKDEALTWLETALARGFADEGRIALSQELATLRDDPRFAALVWRYFPERPAGE